MIKSLHIENYVLIDYLDLNFESGLNIITGETGAGKSILLGAIGLLLGAKSDSSAIMSGASSCVIEGVFDITDYGLESFFELNDIDFQQQTTIRRVITSSKSRIFINDIPVNLTTVRSIGDKVIDIHSQNQTRLLDSENFQIAILDSMAAISSLIKEYQMLYDKVLHSLTRLKSLEKRYSDSCREEEFLRFQHQELSDAKLIEGEQEELESEQAILSNSVSIKEALFSACDLLGQKDDSVIVCLKSISSDLDKLSTLSPELEEMAERVKSSLYEIKDIDRELSIIGDRVSDNPERLAQVESRLDHIFTLQQKYHYSTIKDLISFRDDIESKLSFIDNSSEEIEAERLILDGLRAELKSKADIISQRRQSVTGHIEGEVIDTLAQLGMESSRMRIVVEPSSELLRSGGDRVRFMFTANRGGELQDIGKVSGGEMSRLMLTLKSLVARHTKLPSIVFDEIDTGVSGRVADAMGCIIVSLSDVMQIINITHLPQVAAKGAHHFYVYKEHGDTTLTRIKKLSGQERIEHIASMLSGSEITAAAIKQAKELLSNR